MEWRMAMNDKRPKTSGKAQRDAGMSSPADLRNTTARRKTRDMPEDDGHEDRDPEKDYEGDAKKDH
jgi:hypothetical protein